MNTLDNIPETALGWHREGRGAVLATVVQTWGSALRQAGSQLAISGAGEIAGSVSGGCVEAAVVSEARAALQHGGARILTYGVTNDEAFAAGLACGGTIRVLIEPVGATLSAELLAALVAQRKARLPVAYVVNTADWTGRLVPAPAYQARFRMDDSGFEADGSTFVAIHNPPLRLLVIGAVHIAQALIPMAWLAGYDVSLIDPRGTFATAERFPGVLIREDYPDEVLAEIGLDGRTALVTLSHDAKIDDSAIAAALRSEVFYLGCLGSKRTHAARLKRLVAAGFKGEDIARIHAPVGLDIAAKSPAEIAISVMAELTQVLRRGS